MVSNPWSLDDVPIETIWYNMFKYDYVAEKIRVRVLGESPCIMYI